jgi:hypothetical protein
MRDAAPIAYHPIAGWAVIDGIDHVDRNRTATRIRPKLPVT